MAKPELHALVQNVLQFYKHGRHKCNFIGLQTSTQFDLHIATNESLNDS